MHFKKLLPILVATFVLFFTTSAQEKKAAVISGTVKDAHSKSPLNEAVVTLSSTALQGQKFALTDSTGMYRISNLPPGIYSISFEMEGYEKFVQDSIRLQEGMSLGVSFQMARERKGKDKKIKQSSEKVIAVKNDEE